MHGGVGAQQERRQRVDLDSDQLGIGEGIAGGQKEAPRACARASASVAQRIKAPDEGNGTSASTYTKVITLAVFMGQSVKPISEMPRHDVIIPVYH